MGQGDPRRRNGSPLQCSCLGNPMDREAWRAVVHRVAKESDTTEQANAANVLLRGQEELEWRLEKPSVTGKIL